MDDGTTIDLLRAVRAGDSDAWDRLDERVRKALGLAVRGQVPLAMRAQFDTEIVLQSALAGAYLAMDSYEYRGKGSLEAWLRVIFRNKLRERIRRLRSSKRDIGREVEEANADLVAENELPEDEVARAERCARLAAALPCLPSEQSSLLTAYFFDKQKVEEIVAASGVSESTIYRRMALALARLRDLIDTD